MGITTGSLIVTSSRVEVSSSQAAITGSLTTLSASAAAITGAAQQTSLNAVGDTTAAIMIELIQGEGGINVADRDYVSGLRKLCDEKDLVLIFDD